MRGKRHSYPWQPLTMTWSEVADVAFRQLESWLRDHMPEDFPRPDPLYDVFATEAVSAWVRRARACLLRWRSARCRRYPHPTSEWARSRSAT
jgi:hypothetical protein